MASGQEIELKLSLAPESLARLLRSPLVRPPGARRAVTRALRSVYYDTPRLTLHEHGFVLRVREAGRRYVQTLKSSTAGASGLFRRGEWEIPVQGPRPELAQVKAAGLAENLQELQQALSPVFTSEVRRSTRVLDRGNAGRVEVAVDRGMLVTPKGSTPICEIELELKDGTPDALFDLALALNEVAPLRLETASKSDRGYALLRDDKIAPQRAPALRLDPAMTVAAAMAAILRHNLTHLLANELPARDGGDPEGVHQVRLALRRLRSALSVFAPLLPAEALTALRPEMQWLARELGPARDLDVFLGGQLAPVLAAFEGDPALASLAEAAETARSEAYERVRAAFRTQRYTALLLQVSRLAESIERRSAVGDDAAAALGAPIPGFAAALLTERHRKVKRRGRHLRGLPADERHRLRLAVKKLRYGADFFRSLFGGESMRLYLRQLSRLQDRLGALNDLESMRHLVAGFEEDSKKAAQPSLERAGGLLVGWHARKLKSLNRELAKEWKSFKSVTPFWPEAEKV